MSASAVAAAPRLAAADTGARVITTNAPLTDLSPATTDPTDGASAYLVAVELAGQGTRAFLIVTGMGADAVGSTFGAHVHTGTSVAGQPAIAGPHYRVGESPSPQTEVWLDFTVLPGGVGIGRTSVPFTIAEGGANSVVIYRLPTDPNGAAGLASPAYRWRSDRPSDPDVGSPQERDATHPAAGGAGSPAEIATTLQPADLGHA